MFQPGDMDKFLTPEKLSPEVLVLGEHVAQGNPLRRKQFSEEDKIWTNIASLTRSSMRLAAYAGALTNLAVQADDLHVSEEDRMLLNSLFLSISELTFKYATRTSLYTTHHRRDLALSALGFSERQRAQLTRDMPCEGPYLFSEQFTPRLKEELAVRQQARELAGLLRQSQPPRYHSPGQPRALPHAQAAPPRVTVTLPSPPPNRGSRGGRGRSYRGRRRGQRGQRGHRQAAQDRGGFLLLPPSARAPRRAGGRPPAGLSAGLGGHYGRRLRALRYQLADLLPGGAVRLVPPRMSPSMNRGIAAEVNALCLGGVVERTIDQPELCLSPVFLVPKRSGKFRMILNLKRINLHISPAHFRMETLGSILPLRPGDWTASIDLKDAYHHVPIAPASRDLLGFTVAKSTYHFKALPFGLRPAPRLFTRLVACVAAFLRQRGLRLFCYLDDLLLAAESRDLLSRQLHFLLQTVQALGFLLPSRRAPFSRRHPNQTGPLVEQEATLGLTHLSEEAEALLLRYLKEFYAVQPDAAEQQPRASLLFRSGAEPDPGIPPYH